MRRKVGRSVLAVLVGATACFSWAAVAGAQEGTVPSEPLSWQSAGDSYSSGEGVFGNVGSCAQSDDAYGPVAVSKLSDAGWPVSSRTFTACTGHLVEDYFNARPDAGDKGSLRDWGREQGGPERVDVISMSFGGNDIGFADVLRECLDVPASWVPTSWGEVAPTGCDVAESELTKRVDDLLDPPRSCGGTRRSGDAGFDCDLDIGERRGSIIDFYYDIATTQLSDSGRLYVVGYPKLFASVDQWPGWIKTGCQGIYRGDSQKLGRVAEHFNRKLIEAVDRANAALGENKVHFVDRLADFADGAHELCGTGDDYLNGLAADRGQGFGLRIATSFHPNAAGHSSTADDLIEVVRRTFPTGPDPSTSPLDRCTRESVAAAVGFDMDEVQSDPTCIGEWGWIDACPAEERNDDRIGCTHSGKVIRLVDGEWTVVDALLQDCAETFTRLGAPLDIAIQFYPPCQQAEPEPPPVAPPTPAANEVVCPDPIVWLRYGEFNLLTDPQIVSCDEATVIVNTFALDVESGDGPIDGWSCSVDFPLGGVPVGACTSDKRSFRVRAVE